MKRINVVAAVIKNNGEILCVQRGPSKYDYINEKWEFPGGKVEENETKEEAIIREIKEELQVDISVKEFLLTVEHTYPDFHLTMDCYVCESADKNIHLTEHINFKWLNASDFTNLDWAEADVPIVKKLQNGAN